MYIRMYVRILYRYSVVQTNVHTVHSIIFGVLTAISVIMVRVGPHAKPHGIYVRM